MGVKSSGQITITDITDAYSVNLSMDSISMTGEQTQLGSQRTVTVNVSAYCGGTKMLPVVGTVSKSDPNVTATVGSNPVDSEIPITITFPAGTTSDGYVTIPVTVNGEATFNKTFTYSLALKGQTGPAGPGAYSYDLHVSAPVVKKSSAGAFTPASITFSATRGQGTETPSAYAGQFRIDRSTDGTSWATVYLSSQNESSISYTIPSGTVLLRCYLYAAGGRTTQLDQQNVPVVSDGADGSPGSAGSPGADGADAYTVLLTNESHTFAAGTTKVETQQQAVTNVIAYKGATKMSCYVGSSSSAMSITTGVTGLTCTIANNNTQNVALTFTAATTLETKNGTVTVPVHVDGKTFNKIFSFSLSNKGEQGLQGNTGDKGDKGDNAINIRIESTAGVIFKNSSGTTTLHAVVTVGEDVYESGTNSSKYPPASLGTLKWYNGSTYLTGNDNKDISVSATDVQNTAVYTVKLEV